MISRRRFILGSAALAAGCRGKSAKLRRHPVDDPGSPFGLGIASGDPAFDSVILWTRIASDAKSPERTEPLPVRWAIATDSQMRDIKASGEFVARRENAYCVHIEATGLLPAKHYYYQFATMGTSSPIGRTRTLPKPGQPTDEFRIALTSCMEYSLGYFTALRDLRATQPDIVLHNGDYIYEAPAGSLRPYPIEGEAVSLDDYRALYTRYRQDPDLREAHAWFPWIVIWDDHEVSNDFGPDHFLPSRYNAPMTTENHRLRVKAGRRAFLEHMPLRASLALYDGQDRELYAKDIIGDLLEVSRLDVRSYRDTPVCNNGVESKFEVCPDIYDPDRSMLGRAQERWLFDNFGKSDCKWNCLAQTTVMSPFDRVAGPAIVHESESWDNYAANRSRIVDHIRDREISNVVSLGGNIHAFYAGKVSDGVAQGICKRPALTEIVTTSITAGGGAQKRYDDIHRRRNENPCIDYFDNRYRGYALVTFTRQEVRADLRKVEDVAKPDSNIATLAKLSIPDGEIGIRQLS